MTEKTYDPIEELLAVFSQEAQEAALAIPEYEGDMLGITVMGLRTLVYRDEFLLRIYESALAALQEEAKELDSDFAKRVVEVTETAWKFGQQVSESVAANLLGESIKVKGEGGETRQ